MCVTHVGHWGSLSPAGHDIWSLASVASCHSVSSYVFNAVAHFLGGTAHGARRKSVAVPHPIDSPDSFRSSFALVFLRCFQVLPRALVGLLERLLNVPPTNARACLFHKVKRVRKPKMRLQRR